MGLRSALGVNVAPRLLGTVRNDGVKVSPSSQGLLSLHLAVDKE